MQAIRLNLNENTHLFIWGALCIPLSSYYISVVVGPQFLPVLKKEIIKLILKYPNDKFQNNFYCVLRMPNRGNV